MTRQEFAQILKQFRRQRALTQETAATSLGVSVRTLQNWEIARNMPTGYGLNALLRILNAEALPEVPMTTPTLHLTEPEDDYGALETHLL